MTEGIVLRSLRYAEADRILHVYTPELGRLGAIAKGARRTKSRFGGRLEPLGRVELTLHRGRGDLMTVTSAAAVQPHARLRDDARALEVASRSAEAVSRFFGDGEPHPGVYHLLANLLALLDADATRATPATALAFRLKLLVAAGLSPQLAACASCGEGEHLGGFSGAAGGVVCGGCQAGAFAFEEEAHAFLVGALGRPLAGVPDASARALTQAERAIAATAEHHAGVRLRGVAIRSR